MTSAPKKNALGRGLGALIELDNVQTAGSSQINEIPLDSIEANPNQPRKTFDAEALEELAASIKELGVVQPVTLREISEGRYQIISGERRCRASRMAGLTSIPAYIKTADDEALMEMALVENIQREDLNAIEIALSYQRLIDEYKFTQERLGEKVGKKRATVTNYLRLLKLPAEVQLGLKAGKIEMGHARALVSIQDPADMIRIYEETVKNGYSVRKLEDIVKRLSEKPEPKKKTQKTSDYDALSNRLAHVFKSKVKIDRNSKGSGKIVLSFTNDEQFENIMSILDRLS
ncbi:MAG: ParB/RepB/Spo0J family partition protein [Paludibacteraceae bacterium]|jgi:ParB family chromosome partitioning protein|nr:ParB/RepB/Spo0J family partition protein [Paludibacteraceae bacterium]MBQ6765926.1 ParB/RepB/Spo0J family partition protein [Paludibacteraceae bacterium]